MTLDDSERKITAWLRTMIDLAPSAGRGMGGHLAALLWSKVLEGIERGDHHIHAARINEAEHVVQSGPARPA